MHGMRDSARYRTGFGGQRVGLTGLPGHPLIQSGHMQPLPPILCIGGHDPTGGAGIQADIETVNALGGRALTLITCLTVQDSRDIHGVLPTEPDLFARQLDVLLTDIQPAAIKLGLIGSTALIEPLSELLAGFDGPTILDPVLAAGGGFDLDRERLGATLRRHLLPHVILATPNRAELRRLAPGGDEAHAAATLLADGTRAVLVTGADEASGDRVSNRLYLPTDDPQTWDWPRLPRQYHGSGCTLAAACATRLALGDPLVRAVEQAQQFAWRALDRAEPVGHGQWLPRRGT